MVDFLRKCGISDTVIKEVNDINVNANLYNLNCNQDNIEKIICYLRELNFKFIDELLINRVDLFLLTYNEFKNMYNKENIDELLEKIEL